MALKPASIAAPASPPVPASPPPPPPAAAPKPAAAQASPPPPGKPGAPPAKAVLEAPQNLLDAGGAPPEAAPAEEDDGTPDPGADWRSRFGKNKDVQALLKRYTSEEALGNAVLNMRTQITKGMKVGLAADATPEQVAEYRAANGIAEKLDDYSKAASEGLIVADEDKAVLDGFYAKAHTAGMPPALAKVAVETFLEAQAAAADEIAQANETSRVEGQQALMAEWGSSYKGNLNATSAFVKSLPQDAQGMLMSARGEDGVLLLNRPEFIKALAQVQLDRDPHSTVVAGGQGEPGKNVDVRITEIEKLMRTDRKAYDRDQKVQDEYKQLLAWRESRKEKVA